MEDNGFDIVDKYENINTPQTPIKSFYEDGEIFVTGGTGFLGKALIEKLIRSCEGIKHVYVFMRTKKGRTSEERWDEFKKDKIFNRIRQRNPKLLKKLVLIAGDIGEKNLGINHVDSAELAIKVNIVFHMAATIKFNENLRRATEENLFGTQKLLDFATTFANLKSFVHVSTAYSNATKDKIDEIIYPTEPMDKESFIKCVTELSPKSLDHIAEKLKGAHPNTYTLTKSMTETLVAEYNDKLPICIVRPSIVGAALAEPYPGWVENPSGITGMMIEVSRGMVFTILTEKRAIMDIVPVDIVVNTLITAARATSYDQPEKIRIYNCTSGEKSTITYGDFGKMVLKYARKNPTKHVVVYPNFSFRTCHVIHYIYAFGHHWLPAFVIDLWVRLNGGKPVMMKLASISEAKMKVGEHFLTREYKFGSENMNALSEDVKRVRDGREFDCDISGLNWDAYVRDYMLGIREFVLKDGMESMAAAREKIRKVWWMRTFFRVFLYSMYICTANRVISLMLRRDGCREALKRIVLQLGLPLPLAVKLFQ